MVEQDHRIPEVSEYIRLPLWQQRKEVFMKNRKRLAAVIAAVVLACAAIWWFFFRNSGSGGTDVAYVQKISAMNGSAPLRIATTFLYRRGLRQANRVFVQNASIADRVLRDRIANHDQLVLVPGSGVDLERFQPLPYPTEEKD